MACGSVRLSDSQAEDWKLWEALVDAAAKGISINRLVFRWPSRIVLVNACPKEWEASAFKAESGVHFCSRLTGSGEAP